MPRWVALFASLALALLAGACDREPAPLRAARSFENDPRYGRAFWERERQGDSPLWNATRALCVEQVRATNTRTPTCKELEVARLEAIAAAVRATRATQPQQPPAPTLDYNRLLDPAPAATPSASRRSRSGDHLR